jgi:hypothetical protein
MPLPDLNPRAASALRNAVAATLDDSLLKCVLPAAPVPAKPPAPTRRAQANRISRPAPRNTAPQSAAPRNTAQHGPDAAGAKTNPMRRPGATRIEGQDGPPLKPVQLSAARLLLQGKDDDRGGRGTGGAPVHRDALAVRPALPCGAAAAAGPRHMAQHGATKRNIAPRRTNRTHAGLRGRRAAQTDPVDRTTDAARSAPQAGRLTRGAVISRAPQLPDRSRA